MTIDHRPSPYVQRALHKVHWLRTRRNVDLDVVETLDTVVDAMVRLDAAVRAVQGTQDLRMNRIESKLGQFQSRLKGMGILPTKGVNHEELPVEARHDVA